MRQQINLYQERFYARRVVLPARQIAAIELVVLALLVLVSVGIKWSAERTEAARAELAGEKAALEQNVAGLRESVERQSVDRELEARVSETNKELLARKKVLEWVTESQARNAVTFSALLEGPGRRHVEGLWLSRITIDQAGSALQLKGNVLEPELVPEFLTGLQKEPAYLGREFRKLILEENEDGTGMRFLLTTTPAGENTLTFNERTGRTARRADR